MSDETQAHGNETENERRRGIGHKCAVAILVMSERCGARKQGGELCKNWPIRGRKRCKFHGGMSLRGPDTPQWKNGQSAYVFKGELLEKFRAAEGIEDPTDLLPELAVERAVFSSFIEKFGEGHKLTGWEITSMMQWAESIGRMAERIVKMRNDTMLTTVEMLYLKTEMIKLIDDFIDTDRRQDYIDRLNTLIPGRSESVVIDG